MPALMEGAGSRSAVVLVLGAAFTPDDVREVRALLAHLDPEATVELDFHEVRTCEDVALALLAEDIVRGRPVVVVRGMSHHQQRLLGYLGVPEPRDAAHRA